MNNAGKIIFFVLILGTCKYFLVIKALAKSIAKIEIDTHGNVQGPHSSKFDPKTFHFRTSQDNSKIQMSGERGRNCKVF